MIEQCFFFNRLGPPPSSTLSPPTALPLSRQTPQFPPQRPASPPQAPIPGAPPDNNLGWAIASLIVCWPFGIPSIIKATEVQNLWARGWQQHAEHSAAEAKKWGKIGVIVGASLVALYIIGLLLYFVFLFAVLVPNAH